jgi:phosphohistidine phosphatase
MTQRTILLLRHAEAGPPAAGEGDLERRLTARGRRQADQVNRWLGTRASWRAIDVLVSPARRTQETAERALAGWHQGKVSTETRLWNASLETLFEILEERRNDALVIAHNPGLEQLRRAWTGMLMPVPVGSVHVLQLGADGRATASDGFYPSSEAT